MQIVPSPNPAAKNLSSLLNSAQNTSFSSSALPTWKVDLAEYFFGIGLEDL